MVSRRAGCTCERKRRPTGPRTTPVSDPHRGRRFVTPTAANPSAAARVDSDRDVMSRARLKGRPRPGTSHTLAAYRMPRPVNAQRETKVSSVTAFLHSPPLPKFLLSSSSNTSYVGLAGPVGRCASSSMRGSFRSADRAREVRSAAGGFRRSRSPTAAAHPRAAGAWSALKPPPRSSASRLAGGLGRTGSDSA